MTSVYVPDSGDISPCGYGILFIDLVENKIISSQGYSSVSEIDITGISNWINQSKYDKESLKILKDYEELHKAKKLELVSYDGKPVDKKIKEKLESDDFLNNIEKLFKDKNAYKKIFGLSFKVDLSPFEVFEFGDDDKGLKQAYVEIKKLVKLTAKEEKMWKSEIKERKY